MNSMLRRIDQAADRLFIDIEDRIERVIQRAAGAARSLQTRARPTTGDEDIVSPVDAEFADKRVNPLHRHRWA